MLYGFLGRMDRDTGYLVALGLVTYDYVCVNDEKIRLGNNFFWEKAAAEAASSTSQSSSSSSERKQVIIVKAETPEYEISSFEVAMACCTISLNLILFCVLAYYFGNIRKDGTVQKRQQQYKRRAQKQEIVIVNQENDQSSLEQESERVELAKYQKKQQN